jgi:hypothetical protein
MRRGFLIFSAVLLALAGCTSPAAHPQGSHRTSTPTVVATPSPAATASDSATEYTGPESRFLAPEPPGYVTVVPDQYIAYPSAENRIYRVELPSADGGARQYAEGTPIMEGSKVVAYNVVRGDLLDFIVGRFGLSNDGYIVTVNQVRRGGTNLYAGDVLNLSPYTLHKYGSENGKVFKNPDPIPMLPQEP